MNERCRCVKCGWEGDNNSLEFDCIFEGSWYGDPPLPPEYEARCPECNANENYIEDIDD